MSFKNDIQLYVFDFDGVLTDNRVWVHQSGEETVACNRGDGWWLQSLSKVAPVHILSTETNPVVSARAKKLGLPVLQGQKDKARSLTELMAELKVDPSQVCYVGNDMNDYEAMKLVGFPLAPSDSHPDILKLARYVVPEKGGMGVVRHIVRWLDGEEDGVVRTSETQSFSERDHGQDISALIRESIDTKEALSQDSKLIGQLGRIVDATLKSLQAGGKVIFAGNGGSFSDSIHLSAEFVSRLKQDRAPLASIALGASNSNLTAIGNDYGYDKVFEREILALAKPEDVFIAISTSGNSPNVLRAVEAAKKIGVSTFGWSGRKGGELVSTCETLCVPADDTARIQECHILMGHIFCELVEREYLK